MIEILIIAGAIICFIGGIYIGAIISSENSAPHSVEMDDPYQRFE